ncbi:hypothetical protein ACFL3S_11095, partial [Gemmatimonadota bacterium]
PHIRNHPVPTPYILPAPLAGKQILKEDGGRCIPFLQRRPMMEVHTFVHIQFQKGAWKQVWAEAGRVTYKALQDRATLEVIPTGSEELLRFRADKATKVAISGNGLHLPDTVQRA